MKQTSANLATHPPRLESLRKTVDSLLPQVDVVRIYFNECDPPEWATQNDKIHPVSGHVNLTDNGKFYFLDHTEPDEIYFTCDDDIIYPPDYVATTLRWLERCPIITYHGKRINTTGNYQNSYYFGGHYVFDFKATTQKNEYVHIPGTGVMAIDLAKYRPSQLIAHHPNQKMSDLVFAVQAAIDNQAILTPAHKGDWLKTTRNETSICVESQRADQTKHIELINKLIILHKLAV
jgi:hypothetical protein